ncbi:Fibrous sheath-interacting protein 1 [Plasmopara halstedii]|uniref:Fibrous sheath-interacting protein 1 n=1 Tax=Plasmopara halstedii TaxID=4781 RepID=A0A0P1ALR0_PLAHL|nr:Fibrous sheath-interacting protein 1 [Plasmopara halstedii]CEG42262.1 Fibrous sheath-interacting protein 1 [Plasmopara halstedii]|eukprot:XP_024578631.1 Fibrous sheath-interacting protein 1 [Plasmopara halstedii]
MRRPSSIGALNSPNKQVVTRSLEYNARGEVQCNQPCRPNTTPKPRIQRLLLGPGQNVTHDQTFQNQLKAPLPSKLTYLPDSPPRFQFIDVTDLDNPQSSEAPCEVEQVLSNSKIIAECFESDYGEYRQENLPLEALTPSSGNSDKRLENEELDLSRESVAMKTEKVDVDTYETRDQESNNDVGKIADDDEEYKQALANRGRLLINEANRQRTRSELESYVGSLKAMIDEDGEQLVQFPKNYQQVVSLMTQKDIREGDTASNQDKQTHLNWSRVLIDSGLSKQQAFGIIEEVDDDPECKSKLAAKIALKMARIRQLDTVLEEKLGKNLYANIAPRKQKALRRKGMKKGVRTSNLSSRTFMTQAQSAAPSETLNCEEQ